MKLLNEESKDKSSINRGWLTGSDHLIVLWFHTGNQDENDTAEPITRPCPHTASDRFGMTFLKMWLREAKHQQTEWSWSF